MTNVEFRLLRVENDLTAIKRQLDDIFQQLGKIAQNQFAPGNVGLGSGGGGGNTFFCLPTALGAATGTWPSLTPASQSLTVYQVVSGALSSVGSATVYNFYPAATVASKVLQVKANGDGTYSAVAQSCT
jgi:hypothetical protein